MSLGIIFWGIGLAIMGALGFKLRQHEERLKDVEDSLSDFNPNNPDQTRSNLKT